MDFAATASIADSGEWWNRFREEDRGYDSPCWVWNGALNNHGYARTRLGGKRQIAHRAFYERFVGPVPDRLELHHLCEQRDCVNVAHLQPVTRAENMQFSRSVTKLSRTQVDAIRDLWATGNWYQTDIAKLFGVSTMQVSRIVRRQRWGG